MLQVVKRMVAVRQAVRVSGRDVQLWAATRQTFHVPGRGGAVVFIHVLDR